MKPRYETLLALAESALIAKLDHLLAPSMFDTVAAYEREIAPPLRTRAEVDADKLNLAEMLHAGGCDCKYFRERYTELCAEPTREPEAEAENCSVCNDKGYTDDCHCQYVHSCKVCLAGVEYEKRDRPLKNPNYRAAEPTREPEPEPKMWANTRAPGAIWVGDTPPTEEQVRAAAAAREPEMDHSQDAMPYLGGYEGKPAAAPRCVRCDRTGTAGTVLTFHTEWRCDGGGCSEYKSPRRSEDWDAINKLAGKLQGYALRLPLRQRSSELDAIIREMLKVLE